ncbi:MAG TPA: DEAD/DEAH box helicase [Anaerolineaceae bacterium]
MSVDKLLTRWKADATIVENIAVWQTMPAQAARFLDLPHDLHPAIAQALQRQSILQLYTHQVNCWTAVQAGKNVVVVTGTASGKTLCYNLPVLDALLRDPSARALYLFPTKALAQDQHQTLSFLVNHLIKGLEPSSTKLEPEVNLLPAIYDGDTPSSARPAIRSKARIIFSNPDMLHTGILPHHTVWAELFKNLRFVILDELHIYRGVFGSHVANVVRRLKRIARFYGGEPQFILTSATIANPVQLAEAIIEAPVELVNNDGSARGERNFIIYNPPIVNPELGLRKSATLESVKLTGELMESGVQTIVFGRTRRTVEILLSYLRQYSTGDPESIRGYRSGYLPRDRRMIERELRLGKVRTVVATNALELGIDIGDMGATVMVGYPGTIAATLQQSGRSGRKTESSLALLVATADALDQFLARHPEYLIGKSPEQALIMPDNLLILLQHIRCASFELPFYRGEAFGNFPGEKVNEFLDALEQAGELHQNRSRYFWTADQYPSGAVSLRSASPESILLRVDSGEGAMTIGQVDFISAMWMVHPQAIYLHEAQTYLVDALNLEEKIAYLHPVEVDYYTEPGREVTVEKVSVIKELAAQGCTQNYGELIVTTQVTGYRQVRWYTYELLGNSTVDLPPTRLDTTGYWITLDDAMVETLRGQMLWTNDPNNYGPNWPQQRLRTLERDGHRCQMCGALETGKPHHVHHKTPFRTFTTAEMANRLDNLVTLCPNCHRRAEQAVQISSGLAGLAYVLGNLAPFFVMCDRGDLGVHSDPQSSLGDGKPSIVIYDNIQAGIGLSEHLFDLHPELLIRARETVSTCPCVDGCPSCVGPGGENGSGSKRETLALLEGLTPTTGIFLP